MSSGGIDSGDICGRPQTDPACVLSWPITYNDLCPTPHTHSDSSPLAVIGFVTQVWMWFDGRVWEVDVASVLVQEEVINNPD